MPHIIAKIMVGRTEEQKQRLAAELTRAVMDALGSPEGDVSVAVEDVGRGEWMDKVYKTDIAGQPGLIYKQPSYGR